MVDEFTIDWYRLPGSAEWSDGWVAYVYINEDFGTFLACDPDGVRHLYRLPRGLTEHPYTLDTALKVYDDDGADTGFYVRANSFDTLGTVLIGRATIK